MAGWRRWLCGVEQTSDRQDTTDLSTQPSREDIKALNAYYYDVASKRLNSQFSYLRQIDAKSTSFFTIGSTVLPIVVGFVSTSNSSILDSDAAVYALFWGFASDLLLALFYVLSLRAASGLKSLTWINSEKSVLRTRQGITSRLWRGNASSRMGRCRLTASTPARHSGARYDPRDDPRLPVPPLPAGSAPS